MGFVGQIRSIRNLPTDRPSYVRVVSTRWFGSIQKYRVHYIGHDRRLMFEWRDTTITATTQYEADSIEELKEILSGVEE
jgi:hypothetical protein